MTSEEFDKLIDKNKYQVFVFTCRAVLPFFFARHPWFVINKKGMISRWDVNFRKNRCKTAWNHLHKNLLPPTQGIAVIPYLDKIFWKSKLLDYKEGQENSVISKAVNFIENSNNSYPYCNEYRLLGPNSNTYAQWVLNKFPELNIKLPWNSIGKNYIK